MRRLLACARHGVSRGFFQIRRLVAITTLAFLLPACAPTIAPLVIQLRDAQTHAPITSVSVEADSLALGPSLQFGDVLDEVAGRRAAFISRGRTDETGTAQVKRVPDRAVRVTVLGPGREAPVVLLPNDVDIRPTPWLVMLSTPENTTKIELRAGTSVVFTSQPPAQASR